MLNQKFNLIKKKFTKNKLSYHLWNNITYDLQQNYLSFTYILYPSRYYQELFFLNSFEKIGTTFTVIYPTINPIITSLKNPPI